MSEVVWKNLAKDVADLTKISDEIDSKLGAHNVDESAHSQSNEAIYNHRVGAILDHLDGSTTGIKLAISGKVADAIVAASGGDYTDIQSAVDAGKKAIFVKRGTYSLDADIDIPSDVSIFGEDKYDTIIDLNGDHQIKSVGDTPYTTGTITATIGSAVIVGSGTSWLANLAVNDFIVFNGACYKITAVTDDTHITIEIIYQGQTVSGVSYNAGTFLYDIDLSNFTVKSQDVAALKSVVHFYGIVKSKITDVIVKENDLLYSYGINLEYSYNNTFLNITANSNGYSGIRLYSSDNNILSNITANNNDRQGIYLYSSDNNILSNITANNNGYNGIELEYCYNNAFSNIVSSNGYYSGIKILDGGNNALSNITANNNDDYGIYLTSSDNNALSNIAANNNNDHGVYLYNCYNNTFSNINVNNNSVNGLRINVSPNNTFSGINANYNTNDGISIYDSDDNVLSDMVATNNDSDGIYLYISHNNSLSNINATDNGGEGINVKNSNNNTFSGIVSEGNNRGIYLFDSDSNTISGHSVRENDRNGIRFYRSSYNVISGGVVRDNSQLTHATYSEIQLQDDGATYSTYNIITGNNIRCTLAKKAVYGIRENAAGDNYNLIHGNIVQGAVTANISLQGANSVNADNI